MTIVKCNVPSSSVLDRRLIEAAYFQDSYCAPLSRKDAGIIDVFLAIFAHHPIWMKIALIVRHRMVSFFGLDAPPASDVLNFKIERSYSVGDKIGVWPILALTDTELIAGSDNKHMDFRLSVLKVTNGEAVSVVVSTICVVNNVFGKLYLFFVVPFHKWGVQRIIANAINAGRL
jgi:hypothetical protein